MLVSRFRDDGIGVTVSELSSALAKRGHSLTIGAIEFEAAVPPGINTMSLPPTSRSKPWKLTSMLKNYDLIHNHQSTAVNFSSFWIRTPFIYSFHGIPDLRYSHDIRSVLEKLSLLATSKNFGRIIVPLNCVRRQLERHLLLSSKRIETIHPGVNEQIFSPRATNFSSGRAPRLLYVGDLVRHKRVHLLLHAFARLFREDNASSLSIVGDGDQRASLEDLARHLEIRNAVSFLGRVPRQLMAGVYRSCDVYLTASANEVFGIPLMEAMACGLAVLASPCSAHREIIEASRGGEITNPDSPEEFSNAILQVFQHRERYQTSGLTYAHEHRWDRTAAITETLYIAALSEHDK